MNKKKEIAMIFVVIVAIALGVLIIILSSKGKAADKKQSDTSSETKTSVEIKPPKDKTEEESGLEITDAAYDHGHTAEDGGRRHGKLVPNEQNDADRKNDQG